VERMRRIRIGRLTTVGTGRSRSSDGCTGRLDAAMWPLLTQVVSLLFSRLCASALRRQS
jgi:hypothetical protein